MALGPMKCPTTCAKAPIVNAIAAYEKYILEPIGKLNHLHIGVGQVGVEMAFYRIEFDIDHVHHRFVGAHAHVFVDEDFIGFVPQTLIEVFEGDALHMRAKITRPNEISLRIGHSDIIGHGTFRQEDNVLRLFIRDIIAHGFG